MLHVLILSNIGLFLFRYQTEILGHVAATHKGAQTSKAMSSVSEFSPPHRQKMFSHTPEAKEEEEIVNNLISPLNIETLKHI